jgi:hypothetical protein
MRCLCASRYARDLAAGLMGSHGLSAGRPAPLSLILGALLEPVFRVMPVHRLPRRDCGATASPGCSAYNL